ncbi:hypothetical protein N8T08_005829 [Aspergillus melleus]|uniref:Uncharacterized protein n=1 Tax=Aspergillus melleus TaxID=138277 RepID=A0ACC3B1W9_9EURO|nr:hypothetical protein N8T08_005829 [Aspergillus melleus]
MSRGEQKYNWIDGTESLEKYRPGGYHPVMIGDILHGRYRIVDKLGFGGYSTIWLAQDSRLEHIDQLLIEQIYQEYGEPETVTVTARDGKPLPPNVPAKAVIPLYFGKDAEEFSLSDARVILGDFGEAFSLDEVRRGEDCHTPLAMRPPEARFEPHAPLTYSADIWSLATTIWEILGMKSIFSREFATADEVVSQQIDVLGSMPLSWWKCWEERSQFFDEYGRPKAGRYVWPHIDQAFEEGVQMYRRKSSRVCEFDREETAAILELIKRMLAFRPEERPTAEEVLKSDWIVKWVLPDFNGSLELK